MKNIFPILILTISLAIPDQGRACTCIDEYTTLCETFEGSRRAGSSIFRGIVTRQMGDGIQVESLEMLTGYTFFKEIFLAKPFIMGCTSRNISFTT